MSGTGRKKHEAVTRPSASATRQKSGSGSGGKAAVESSPIKAKKSKEKQRGDDASDARAEALQDARAESEALEYAVENSITPPPELSAVRSGERAGGSERTRTLEMNKEREKANDAIAQNEKMAAELALLKAQLQKLKRKEPDTAVAVTTTPKQKAKVPAAVSRKKQVMNTYDLIKI